MTFPRGGDLEPPRELPHKEITDSDAVRPIGALDSSVLSKTFSNPITTIQRGFPQSPTTPKSDPFPKGRFFYGLFHSCCINFFALLQHTAHMISRLHAQKSTLQTLCAALTET